MKTRVLQPTQLPNGGIIMREIEVKDIKVDNYSLLSIDGSTSNSGLAIIREYDGALLYSISAKRDTSGETPVHYKIRLKKVVKEILINNKHITNTFYEEPTIAHASAIANLFALRTFMEEMIIEEEPNFNYLKHYEINNMRWKHQFLAPDKVPNGTENQKIAVRKKLEAYLPFLNVVTQDEIDAICMGYVAAYSLRKHGNADELKSKSKARAFQYNINFIGADKDDDMLTELWDIYDGPKKLMENGISFTEIDNKTKFDKHVYETMGDEDKLLIIKFSSKHHANLILQYRIGHISTQYDYLYALVWRKSRK